MKNYEEQHHKLNNKGISLVELIIAISIGVIVAGSIAALMTFSLRIYNNESVNAATQYDLQTSINMITDEIMASSTLVVVQNAAADVTSGNALYTKYALFGNPNSTVTIPGGSTEKGFKGVIFASSSTKDSDGTFKIFMNRVEKAGTDLESIASTCYSEVAATFSDNPSPYLLSGNVTTFAIEPASNSIDETNHKYTNPVEVKVELKFKKNGWGTKKYEKRVEDVTYMRNKVYGTIFIDGTAYELLKKED